MGKSKIEWTDVTWNPIRGCVKTSPGCKHCYAEAFAERWRGVKGHAYERGFDPRTAPDQLGKPLTWRQPRRVFVNSMSDLFLGEWTDEYIAAVWGVMAACPQHTFQVLTKHPDRMQQWFGEWVTRLSGSWGPAHPSYVCAYEMCRELMKRDGSFAHEQYWREYGTKADVASWPLPNVWMGVTVEDRKYGVPRIARLRATPAAKRFLSAEPLLEDLGTIDLSGIDLVIAGAESGRRARPLNEDWVRSLRDQCAAQGVAFFYKQRLNERGHKVSLPLLDGVRHDVMP